MRLRGFFIALLISVPGLAAANHQLVLVTASECPANEISMLDVRKAYLGIGVELHGYPVRAYRLSQDETVTRLFFQNIVAMSEKSYDRRMLSLAIKYGTPRPSEFDSVSEMAAALRRRSCSIGHMWREDAALYSDLRVIKILWQQS